jgi:hypothetical protein
MAAPIPFRWNGEAFEPLSRHREECDREFVIGEIYRLAEVSERSQASHNHYFAALHQAWLNLPETIAAQFPSEEHLRKHALIKAGYVNIRQFLAESTEQATKLAKFLRPLDEYCIVTTEDSMVTVWTAKSQSMRAMKKKEFEESKAKVLDVVAAMIGSSAAELTREGAANAAEASQT